MTGDVRVVEDGLEEAANERAPRGPSWLWLAVGFVSGLGLAIVFFTAGSEPQGSSENQATFPEVVQPAEEIADQPASETTVSEPEGVGEVVQGFPDTLVAVTQVSGNLSYLTWPLSGPPLSASMAGFSSGTVRFDSSGRLLAMASPVADSDLALLSMGAPQRIRAIAADVSGFAFHDSEAGRLAYTQVVDGEWQLWTVDASLEPELITGDVGAFGSVASWGDWGYAVQDEGAVTLLTPAGEVKAQTVGRALDSAPDGWLAVSDDGLKLVSAGGGVRRLEADELGILGEVESASFSPDGTKLDVVGGGGHLIIPLDGEGQVVHAPVTSGFPQLAWSSDSRFVVSPWIRGVLIIDSVVDGKSYTALTRQTVVAVATIPLANR